MAKRKVNKSKEVREYLNENPDAMPKDVVEAMKARKITVTAQVVSTIKSTMKSTPAKSGQSRTAKSSNSFTLATLLETKALVDKLGGLDVAREALDVLAHLR